MSQDNVICCSLGTTYKTNNLFVKRQKLDLQMFHTSTQILLNVTYHIDINALCQFSDKLVPLYLELWISIKSFVSLGRRKART